MTAQEIFPLELKKHFGNGEALYRQAFSIVKDSDDAEDVVQTALMKAYLAYSEEINDFPAWLFTILRRVAYTAHNHRSRRDTIVKPLKPDVEPAAAVYPDEGELPLKPIRKMLETALTFEQITRKEYEVLRYDSEFNDRKELAAFLNISRNYCDQLHFRGLKKFVRSIFTHSITLLGGRPYVESLFLAALLNPPPEFTFSEAEVFREQIIQQNADFQPDNWETTLLSACYKMLYVKELKNKIVF